MIKKIFSPIYFIPFLMFPAMLSCSLGNGSEAANYILVYGVSDYSPQGITSLNYTDDDAEGIAALFDTKGYDVRLRIDNGDTEGTEDATLARLKQDIEELSTVITEKDTFVLYYSGHGGRHFDRYQVPSNPPGTEGDGSDSDDEWLFLYSDILLPEFDSWNEVTVSDDSLNILLKEIPTHKKIIIIDACNSGGFIGSSDDYDGIIPNYSPKSQEESSPFFRTFLLSLIGKSGTEADIGASNALVISAAGEREYSWENGAIGGGIFTYYFIESGVYGDADNNGYITLLESFNYTVQKIDEKWNYTWSNYNNTHYAFHPHVSGGPVDFVLFNTD